MNIFEKVKEKLPFNVVSAPYTLDFAVCPRTLRCWIIEINNPPPKVYIYILYIIYRIYYFIYFVFDFAVCPRTLRCWIIYNIYIYIYIIIYILFILCRGL